MVYKWLILGVVAALALQWTLTEVQADSQLSEDELALLREVKELASAKKAYLEARDMGDISCDEEDIECICRYYEDLCFDCSTGCGDDDECMTECLQESLEKRMLETAQQQQRNFDNSLNDENAPKKRIFGRFRFPRIRIPAPRFRRVTDWGRRLGK